MKSHSEQKNQSHVPGPKTWRAFWSTDCPCGCIRATLEVGKRWNGIEKTMVSGKGWKILGNWWKLWKLMLNNVVMLIRAYFVKHVLFYRRNIKWNEYRVCIQLGPKPGAHHPSKNVVRILKPDVHHWAILSMEPSCLPYPHRTVCTFVTVRHWMDKSEYVVLIAQMSIANRNNP